MTRTRILQAAAAALVLATVPLSARGDGGMIPMPPYDIRENVQFAYLDWEQDTGTEQLTVLPGFRGDAREFVWLMPVPSEPVVTAGDAALFSDLRSATGPIWRHRDDGWNCSRDRLVDYAAGDGSVEIISDDVIDLYRVLVVRAEDADALADSLLAWGHLHDGNVAEVTPILDDYVAEGWAFVAARVDSAAFVAAYPGAVEGSWYHGALSPLVFSFTADRPVYPMRLSRVSADAMTWIELYVEADHRYEHALMDAVYANPFSAEELEGLQRWHSLAVAKLSTGRFLTRLQGNIIPAQMDADFIPRRASDDREFRTVQYSGWPATSLLLGGAMLVWVGRKWRRWRGRAAG